MTYPMSVNELTTVWLFGEHDFPDVEVNGHESMNPAQLPVSARASASVTEWLTIAGFRSGYTQDEMLAAGVRAAVALAADLPSHVRVNFAMRLSAGPTDQSLGEWVSLDVDRAG